MDIIILILALILLSYILSGRAFRIKRPTLAIHLTYGAEFAVIGALLGPYVLNVLTPDLIDKLEPLINICLGWIGLMFGFQLRFKDLKLLPLSNYFIAGIETGTTFVFMLITFLVVKDVFGATIGYPPGGTALAFVLAAIAMVSSPSIITAVIKRSNAHGRVSRTLQYISSFDNVLGVAAFGLIYPFFHYSVRLGDGALPGFAWLIISIGAGIALGALFHCFITPRSSSNQNLIIAVGMITFSTGIAYDLHLSALVINVAVGAVLCNYSERYDRFYRLLVHAERPLYVILLIMAGALWRMSILIAALAIIFIIVRAIAKSLGGMAAFKRYPSTIKHPGLFGSALLAQGAMALAIAIDYRFLMPGETSSLLIGLVLTTLALNGLISPHMIKHLLKREGEIA